MQALTCMGLVVWAPCFFLSVKMVVARCRSVVAYVVARRCRCMVATGEGSVVVRMAAGAERCKTEYGQTV